MPFTPNICIVYNGEIKVNNLLVVCNETIKEIIAIANIWKLMLKKFEIFFFVHIIFNWLLSQYMINKLANMAIRYERKYIFTERKKERKKSYNEMKRNGTKQTCSCAGWELNIECTGFLWVLLIYAWETTPPIRPFSTLSDHFET